MMGRSINWFGLSAGIITLIVLVISFYVPWWQLTIGENLIKVNASPVNTNFGLFWHPIYDAVNLGFEPYEHTNVHRLRLVMLIYSLNPTKSYSKHLLGFSYKKPLYVLISFVACREQLMQSLDPWNEHSSHGLNNPYFADTTHRLGPEH